MEHQTKEKPLFQDLLWSRPERKEQAGRLLVIGGSTHGFSTVAEAIKYARGAGIGEVKALLPRGLAKYLPPGEDFVFTEQTSTGSFAKEAAEEAISYSGWANAILVTDELTRNAETTVFIEQILGSVDIPSVVYGEGVEAISALLIGGELSQNICVLDLPQAQSLVGKSPLQETFLSRTPLQQRADLLQKLASITKSVLVLFDEDAYLIAQENRSSYTKVDMNMLVFSANSAVLAAQFPSRLYEAAVSALVV